MSARRKEDGHRPAGASQGWVLYALVALVTLMVFLPGVRNGFVNYDDPDYVTENRHVQEGINGASLKWAFTTGHASNWHPLTWVSHMVDWSVVGARPAGHHLTSVLLHVASTVLLSLWLALATGKRNAALVAGLLFGIHPLHVESVAWISERKDVLSGFFFFLALLAYTMRFRRPSFLPNKPWAWYGCSLVMFALGLMSKPMLVTFPFVLLLVDLWPLGRWTPGTRGKRVGMLLLEKIPFLVLSAASCVVTYYAQQHGGAVSVDLPFAERLGNAVVSYARYIGKFLVPVRLSVLYPHPGHWPAMSIALSIALLIAASVLAFAQVRKRPYVFTGWGWFIGMMVPVIGLVQVGIQSMADRYMYLPMAGLCFVVAWGVDEVIAQRRPLLLPLRVAGGIAAVVLVWMTVVQLNVWRDSETLFRRAIEVTDRNYLAYNNLGFHLARNGRSAEAKEYYAKSLEINPAYEDALNNMGFVLAGERRFQEAVSYYEAGLRVRPHHPEIHNNLGNALSELGRIEEAISHYREPLKYQPDHADAHNNLAIALAMTGRVEEALPHFAEALRLKPNNASGYSNLGNAYAVQKKWAQAIEQYEKALQIKPDDPQAHNNLANALLELNRVDEAISHYRTAVKLRAENPEAFFNLGLALIRQNRKEEAAANFREALRLKPDYAAAAQQLRALESGQGK